MLLDSYLNYINELWVVIPDKVGVILDIGKFKGKDAIQIASNISGLRKLKTIIIIDDIRAISELNLKSNIEMWTTWNPKGFRVEDSGKCNYSGLLDNRASFKLEGFKEIKTVPKDATVIFVTNYTLERKRGGWVYRDR